MPVTEENVFIYISGYLLRCVFKKHTCHTYAILAEKDNNLNCYLYIFFKAYDNQNNIYGNLYVPSAMFINYVKELHLKFFDKLILILFPKRMLCKSFYKF